MWANGYSVPHMHSNADKVVAANIAAIADMRRIPLKTLAAEVGISHDRLRDYTANGRGRLWEYETERIAKVLGVDLSVLTAEVA